MGAPASDKDAFDYEKPQHHARITKPFWLGMHSVTVGQFRMFVDESKYDAGPKWREAARSVTDDYPVTFVSWDDADAFCKWLTEKEGRKYSLPTEAQWEYACRAGTKTRYSFGDDESDLGDYAWFFPNANNHPHPVGQKRPNAWGLFDMQGNAWQWCNDWFDGKYYSTSPSDDPPGPADAEHDPANAEKQSPPSRVPHGADAHHNARYYRSSLRHGYSHVWRTDETGFRVAHVQTDD